ncbi:MAG: hypothetical protein K2X25_04870 [Caulobacteraceae bacterium]|nr:hypothetical protein [Caulobacteraceae bacterium]
MFGGKKQSATGELMARPAQPQTEECLAIACFGIDAFNKETNRLASEGWILVNGCMAGTAHYAYMKRAVTQPPES